MKFSIKKQFFFKTVILSSIENANSHMYVGGESKRF